MWNERNKDGTPAHDHVGGWWKVSIQEKLNKESGSKEDSRDSPSLSRSFLKLYVPYIVKDLVSLTEQCSRMLKRECD